jgi:hypothetical protein
MFIDQQITYKNSSKFVTNEFQDYRDKGLNYTFSQTKILFQFWMQLKQLSVLQTNKALIITVVGTCGTSYCMQSEFFSLD